MRKLIVSILLCLPLIGIAAKEKAPAWIYSMEKDYLIASAEGATVEIAQEKAMLKIRQQIMASIAQQVKSSSTMTDKEVSVNDAYASASMYESTISVETKDYPFLSGISASMVADTYLETVKQGKQVTYRYFVKYPYSRFDMEERVMQFLAYENSINEQLQAFNGEDFMWCESVEDMLQRISALKVFQSSLLASDSRRNVCDKILSRYADIIRSLIVSIDDVTRTGMTATIYYGSHPLSVQQAPKVKSECLQQVASRADGAHWRLTYSYAGCYTDEPNKVDVSFVIYGKKIVGTAYIQ